MKKKYLKPEVEYINLEAEDVITDLIDGAQSVIDGNHPEWGEDD